MKVNVAINGFGRIGRQAVRIIQEKHPELHVVLINDLTDGAMLAHLFEFDSTYGHFSAGKVSFKDGMLKTERGDIRITASKDPAALPAQGAEGRRRPGVHGALHVQGGSRAAPEGRRAEGDHLRSREGRRGRHVCIGVNHETYDPKTMHVISNASCTTNCLAPMAKVLHEDVRHESTA